MPDMPQEVLSAVEIARSNGNISDKDLAETLIWAAAMNMTDKNPRTVLEMMSQQDEHRWPTIRNHFRVLKALWMGRNAAK